MSDGNLAGKVALISGGAGGVGSATAKRLAGAGASIAIVDIDGTAAERLASELGNSGHTAHAFAADLAQPAQIEALDARIGQIFGGVDILVNNAANLSEKMRRADVRLHEISVEAWDEAFATNVRGAMLLTQCAIRYMLARGGGAIVNISSGSAFIPNPEGQTAYGATKGALNSMTRYIAAQYGRDNIRCNAILPGLVLSDRLKEAYSPEAIVSIEGRTMLGRACDPADIAAYVHFLVSDDSRQVTGELVRIDGGRP